ncbi:hypothetical protein E2C01_037376 [Portunus trituberculatus]|uniref:Uncharacterized protein n=1 Tax=Portunus trituberculatus TaxID=210409 RepID=A0A5B7FGY0_PORTR|nr:hypothetical protein [Portunus trituberculatus]
MKYSKTKAFLQKNSQDLKTNKHKSFGGAASMVTINGTKRFLEIKNAIVSMAATHSGAPHEHLPITCPDCFLLYGDFVATYYKDTK